MFAHAKAMMFLLDSPAQMFTADEITFNPRINSDLIDNL